MDLFFELHNAITTHIDTVEHCPAMILQTGENIPNTALTPLPS